MDCWPPPPSPPPGRISSHVCSAPIWGFICAQCPADVCLQIALHRPHLAPAALTGSWCSPRPRGEQHSWAWSWEQRWEHTLGLEKRHPISFLCIHTVTQQDKGASTEMCPRSGFVGVQHPHTEPIWLTDPKLPLKSPFFYQQAHVITRQHMKAISSGGPHILNCTLCFCVCQGTASLARISG